MVRGKQHPQPINRQNRQELFQRGPVLSEINLLHYPICLLSNNNLDQLLEEAARRKESHISLEVTDSYGTKRIWRVNPNVVTGYTRPFDKKVLVTVLKLVSDEGFPPPILWKLGSLKRVCRTMGISDRGGNPGRVRGSLERLSSTSIYAETFFLKESETYWKEKTRRKGGVFTLWSVFWKGEELPGGEVADTVYLHFNAPFIYSLHNFYVKPLDYEFWLKLSPLQQRLYELTGLKFYGLKDSAYITFEYPALCRAMPIALQEHFSDARRILGRAHRVLTEEGWFKKTEWLGGRKNPTLNKADPWTIRYYPGERAIEEVGQAKERLRKFQRKRVREELPAWQDVQGWVIHLSELLQDTEGRNKGFYTKIGKLVVQGKLKDDLVWEAAHVAKTEDLAGNVERNRSAFFTDYLKRQLKKRGRDLAQLLQEV